MNRPDVYAKYGYIGRDQNKITLNKYSSLIQWKKCPTILEIGCADGTTTRETLEPRLPRDYAKFVAADVQESMVTYAKKKCDNNKMDFVQFDIEGEKLLNEKYDHIFSFFVFHYMKDLRKAYSNIYELLKPGGDFLISFIAYHPCFVVLENLLTYPAWSAYSDKVTIAKLLNFPNCRNKIQYMKAILKENKFINVEVNVEHSTIIYKDWDDCLEFFMSVDQILPKLSEQQRIEYTSNFYDEMIKVFGADSEKPDGRIVTHFENIITYGSKPLDGK